MPGPRPSHDAGAMNAPHSAPSATGIANALLLLVAALGLGAVTYAGFLVYVGITSDEMFAGLGVLFGILIGAPAIAAVAAASGCRWLLRRDPGAGRRSSIVLGAMIAAGAAALGMPLLSWVTVVPFLVGLALLVAAIASPMGPARAVGSAEEGEGLGWGSGR